MDQPGSPPPPRSATLARRSFRRTVLNSGPSVPCEATARGVIRRGGAARDADDRPVDAPRPDGHGGLRAGACERRELPALRRRALRASAPDVRDGRVRGVPALRGARVRLRSSTVPRLWLRAARGLLVQTARCVFFMRRTAHERNGREDGRPGVAGRADAAMGLVGAIGRCASRSRAIRNCSRGSHGSSSRNCDGGRVTRAASRHARASTSKWAA